MSQARVFVSQEALESWLTTGRAVLAGDALTVEGFRFRMEAAVHFAAEVAGGADELSLVGRVKTLNQLGELSAEHSHEAVLLGDNAYQVEEGYTLTYEGEPTSDPYPRLIKQFVPP